MLQPMTLAEQKKTVLSLLQSVRRRKSGWRGASSGAAAGAYLSRFPGQGVEFEYLREYHDGDELRSIDWNVTARMRSPYVKKYIEERDNTFTLAIDVSASTGFGRGNSSKRQIAAQFCAHIGNLAVRNKDRLALVLFSDKIELYLPPQKSERYLLRILHEALFHQPQNTGTDIGQLATFFGRVLHKKSTIFILSDFFDRCDYHSSLVGLRKKHDLILTELYFPEENALPDLGVIRVEDPESGQTFVLDTAAPAARLAYAQLLASQQRERAEHRLHKGYNSIVLDSSLPSDQILAQYFRRTRGHN